VFKDVRTSAGSVLYPNQPSPSEMTFTYEGSQFIGMRPPYFGKWIWTSAT
jgi:hypothetical protein